MPNFVPTGDIPERNANTPGITSTEPEYQSVHRVQNYLEQSGFGEETISAALVGLESHGTGWQEHAYQTAAKLDNPHRANCQLHSAPVDRRDFTPEQAEQAIINLGTRG